MHPATLARVFPSRKREGRFGMTQDCATDAWTRDRQISALLASITDVAGDHPP